MEDDHSTEEKTEAAVTDSTLHGAMSGSGSTYQEALLGLMGGMLFGAVSPFVGHPFDSIKTRM